jgi:hypothetical protein
VTNCRSSQNQGEAGTHREGHVTEKQTVVVYILQAAAEAVETVMSYAVHSASPVLRTEPVPQG